MTKFDMAICTLSKYDKLKLIVLRIDVSFMQSSRKWVMIQREIGQDVSQALEFLKVNCAFDFP